MIKLKIGAKVTLTVNLVIQLCLINGQTGNVSHIEFTQGSVQKVYVNFPSEQANLKAMGKPYLDRQNSWVPIEKCKAKIPIKSLNFFNLINFNHNKKKLKAQHVGCRNDVAILDKFDANVVSIFSFKNNAFSDKVFSLMLVYRKESTQMQEFFQMLQYLVATCSIDIIVGDFNYNLLSVVKQTCFHRPCPDGR